MGAQFGDLRGPLDKLIALNKRQVDLLACGTCQENVTSAGVDSSIPAGFKSIAIVKTSQDTDTVTITLSDGSTYDLTVLGESFEDAASPNGTLPAYTIATGDGGTWKWHGIK